jgi:hypothetical protein
MMALAAPAALGGLKKMLNRKKKGAGKAPAGAVSTGYRRKRRKARLTQGDIMELTNIKNILGRTAAANALPYYLGRGRG